MIARRLTLLALCLLCMLAGAFAFLSVPGFALNLHAHSSSFGEPCRSEPCGAGQFKEPSGVAINEVAIGEVGDVYVVDKGDDRVEWFAFNSTSKLYEYAGQFDGGKTPGKSFSAPEAIAVDNSTNPLDPSKGDVYVVDTGHQVVDKFGPGGDYLGQITAGEGGAAFGELDGLAVDSEGRVWVYQASDEIDDYSDAEPNTFIAGRASELAAFGLVASPGFAVDAEGNFYAAADHNEFFKLTSSGSYDGFEVRHADAAAVDLSNNNVYIDKTTMISLYNSAKTSIESFGEGVLNDGAGVAVDSSNHAVYVSETATDKVDVFTEVAIPDVTTGSPSGATPTGATLNGTVNLDKEGAATCEFEWGESESLGQVAPCSNTVEGEGTLPVEATIEGLTRDTTYYYRLQATNKIGTNYGAILHFIAPGPGLHGESVADVASSSATLQATFNPNSAPTSYYFEYGPTAAYGTDAPAPPGQAVDPGEDDVQESQHIQGLAANTVYHYRVVVLSELQPGTSETFSGPDQTFTTQPAGGEFALPDGRQWELVSPPNKHGATLKNDAPQALFTFGGATQAADDGAAMTYLASAPTELEPSGYGSMVQVLSERGPQGWSSRDITPIHGERTGEVVDPEYQLFSANLSSGFVFPTGGLIGGGEESVPTLLSAQASEPTPYIRREGLCDAPAAANECYLPLLTGEEGYADVRLGTKFGERGQILFQGASPDLSHVVLSSTAALTTASLPRADELYEWSAGKPPAEALQMVSVLPASEGGGPATSENEYLDLGIGVSNVERSAIRHAISNDGARVFWKWGSGLYLRDTVRGETLRLDVQQPGAPTTGPSLGGETGALFQAANSDGSKVFFTDGNESAGVVVAGPSHRLTAQSGSTGQDLYECEIGEEAGKLGCKLTDLTPENGGQSAEVQHMVVGASEDGSYVYFVANGVLPGSGATQRGTCEAGQTSAGAMCNLYVDHNGVITFVAMLSQEDESVWGDNGLYYDMSNLLARVSPDGRYLAFMSDRPLTGYDNRDANSGKPDMEVYMYDAQTQHLACASCNPTGGLPVGVEINQLTSGSNIVDILPGSGGNYGGENWVAANVPGGEPLHDESLYQPRYLSDRGQLFFNSNDALVPQDINGTEDVYEFELAGVGTCRVGGSSYNRATGACVSLISSGTSSEEAGFLDASEDGSDVFFLTTSRLTSQDVDMSLDVYDAHECSVSASCVTRPASPPPCASGDACKTAPAPQPAIFGAPASSTFAGAGNRAASVPGAKPKAKAKSETRAQKLASALRTCRKKPKRKRAGCERQARRRYATKATRKAVKAMRKGQG